MKENKVGPAETIVKKVIEQVKGAIFAEVYKQIQGDEEKCKAFIYECYQQAKANYNTIKNTWSEKLLEEIISYVEQNVVKEFATMDELETAYAEQLFVHSSEKDTADSITEKGLGASGNPVLTRGIYTFLKEDADESYDKKQFDHYHIRLKKGSKILYTDSDRPLDYLIGNFNSPFRAEWDKIIKNTGISGPEEIMAIFGKGEVWFTWKAKFHREIEKYLEANGYAGIQEGGQIVITNLDAIESVKRDGVHDVPIDKVRKYKHGKEMQ